MFHRHLMNLLLLLLKGIIDIIARTLFLLLLRGICISRYKRRLLRRDKKLGICVRRVGLGGVRGGMLVIGCLWRSGGVVWVRGGIGSQGGEVGRAGRVGGVAHWGSVRYRMTLTLEDGYGVEVSVSCVYNIESGKTVHSRTSERAGGQQRV